MEAKKIIQLDLPDEIEIGLVDKTKYSTIESQVAFYNLLIKEGEKYYKRENLWDDKMNRDLIGLLKGEVHSLKEDLERERMNNKPLGFMFSNLVIEIELDMFDTIEEQIEYLKRKIRDFDIATINVVTDEYDYVKDNLKQQIVNRYNKLKNTNVDWEGYVFNEYWDKIVFSNFKPQTIDNILDKLGMNEEDKFREFIRKKYRRKTREEWIKQYDNQSKIESIESINKDERLSELEKHHKTVNVWDYKFLDSDLGKETLGRLKLFEEKFVKDNNSEKAVEQEKVKAAIGITNNRINEQDEINDNLKKFVHKRKNNAENGIKRKIEDISDGSLDLKEKIIKLEKLYIEQRTKRWELSELFHKDLKNSVIETELRQTDENMNDCQKKIKTLIIKNFENDKKQIYESVKTDSKIDTHNFEYKLILAHMNVLSENDRLDYLINVKNEIDKIKKIEEMYRDSQFMSAQEIMEQIPDINIDYIKYELYYDIIVGFILDFKNGEINIAESIPTEIEEEFYNKVNKVYELIKIEIERLEKIVSYDVQKNYKEKETGVKSRREDDWDFKKEIEKLLDGLTEADTVEEKIYKDIEYWEKFSRVKDRGTDDIWIGESWQIAVGMLKTFINDLKQAQVTGYYKGKKIDFIAAERLNRFLLDVIEAIESDNKENGADEFNEEKIEEVKLLKSGKSVDMPIDESEQPEQGNESQRDKIRKFLKENYPNFINDPANETNLAKEFVDLTYTALQGRKKKNAINSVRIEMIGMKKGEISLDIKPKNSK